MARPPATTTGDSRTTPPAFRVPSLAALGAFALWLFGCAVTARGEIPGQGAHAINGSWTRFFWLGHWRMFTEARPSHLRVRAEVQQGSVWSEVDLDAAFPSSGIAGPGHQQGHFFQRNDEVRAMAVALCGVVSPAPATVRVWLQEWDKTPGSSKQPLVNERMTMLADVACGATLP